MVLINTRHRQGPQGNTVTKLDDLQRSLGVSGSELTAIIQDLYSIALLDTQTGDVRPDDTLDPAGRRGTAEYFFRVPPKVHEFAEPFSTVITPTQNGGKFIESHGSIIKDIKLQGTTGLRPNKVAPREIPLLGIRTDQIDILLGEGFRNLPRTISTEEITGHDDIIFLRNLFRRYSDLKASDALASRTVMLWRNIKDADYWVVEPVDFRLSQSSSSPLTYEYHINFKALSKFDFAFNLGHDPLDAIRDRSRFYSRLQEYSQTLLNSFLTISTQINRLVGLGISVATLLLSPLNAVLHGIASIKSTLVKAPSAFFSHVLSLMEGTLAAIEVLGTKVEFFPPGDPVYRAFKRLVIVASRLMGERTLRDSVEVQTNVRRNSAISAYNVPGSLTAPRRAPYTGGSSSFLGSERTPSGVSYGTVGTGEDIRGIAARLLGSRSRWQILVILNGMIAPYIDETPSPGVLGPGDTILYPSADGADSSTVTPSASNAASDNQDTNVNSPIQQAYGRDVRLASLTAGGVETTDLALSQRGDISTVSGIANIDQAIRVKFATEQGELTVHRTFGTKFSIGKKATPTSLNSFRINTLQTFYSDQRIKDVKNVKFISVGDTLVVDATVILKDTNEPLSLDFALRRF